MKKISVWLVILLTLVTFGIYAIFWAGRNRDYIVKNDNKAGYIPKWLWLIAIPLGVGVVLITSIMLIVLATIGIMDADVAMISIYVAMVGSLVIPLAIGLWWLWYFGAAIQKITQGRIGRIWTLFLYVLAGPFVVAFHQYYINRLDQNEKGVVYATGPGVIVITAVLALISIPSYALSFTSFYVSMDQTRTLIQTSQMNAREANRLSEIYTACVTQLEIDFPGDLTAENEQQYNAAYETCNEIYKRYEAAFDRYVNG